MEETRTWRASITVALHDDGAALLEYITGIRPDTSSGRVASPHGEISVEVEADSIREAFALALEQAAGVARIQL